MRRHGIQRSLQCRRLHTVRAGGILALRTATGATSAYAHAAQSEVAGRNMSNQRSHLEVQRSRDPAGGLQTRGVRKRDLNRLLRCRRGVLRGEDTCAACGSGRWVQMRLHRGLAGVPLARRANRRSAPLPGEAGREANDRPAVELQVQRPPLASYGRPGLAHRRARASRACEARGHAGGVVGRRRPLQLGQARIRDHGARRQDVRLLRVQGVAAERREVRAVLLHGGRPAGDRGIREEAPRHDSP